MQAINTSPANHANAIPSGPEIAQLAFRIWEMRGRPSGRDEEFWLQAEAQLVSERRAGKPEIARLAPPRSAAKRGSASKSRA